MAGIHGKGTIVLMDETPVTVDVAETTVFNSAGDSKEYVTGNADATLTAGGFWPASSSDSLSVDATLSAALATSSLNVWTYWPDGTSTGKFGYGVTSIETGYTITTPVDGTIDVSVDGQVSDGRDRIESLRTLSCGVTSTGNGASDDNGAASTNGGIGYLQRITNSTNDFDVAIQHSAVGTTWDDLIQFSSGTGRTGERIAVAGTVKQFTREVHTTTGALGTAIFFNVGFRRK